MSDEQKPEIASSELELDGKIYLITRDAEGNVVDKDQLDGELCLKVMIAVLDDSLKHPYLEKLVEAGKSLAE